MSSTIDLSLDRVRKLVAQFPPYTRPTIHITGTNGKGSVSSIVSSILHESGLKVGRFNSPHLMYVRDSISVDQRAVSEELYRRTRSLVEKVNSGDQTEQGNHDKEKIGATLFEVLTVTALRIFEEEAVDVAVVEVGMGGRLDATNILPDNGVVKVSAMTAVDVDHVRWLGDSVSAIAKEKAGIVRRDAPLVLGPQKWTEVEGIVKESITEVGSTMRMGATVTREPTAAQSDLYPTDSASFRPYILTLYSSPNKDSPVELELPLLGSHQIDNLSTALGIIECLREKNEIGGRITSDSIRKGVKNTRWPGRLEYILSTPEQAPPFTILADGAHNSASATALRQYLDTLTLKTPSISFIVALSHSPPKTPLETLKPLLRTGDRIAAVSFSPVEDMPWVAPVDPREILTVAQELVGPSGEVWPKVEQSTSNQESRSLLSALEWASQKSDLVVVAGSLYLIADLYRLMEMYPRIFRAL